VIVGMVFDFVALGFNLLNDFLMGSDLTADKKKSSFDPESLQDFQHPRGINRVRSVIKSQGHYFFFGLGSEIDPLAPPQK